MTVLPVGNQPCYCERPFHSVKLVAITGGPGAGKTAVLEMAKRSFCEHVAVLPEAAGIVFGGGFPRHDSDPGRRAAQRAIYHIQRQAETLAMEEGRVAVALCDRGTLDGLAYWPDEPGALWAQVATSIDAELARYDAVVHLRTPPVEGGYHHGNALRIESADEARRIDARILEAWSHHPRRVVVRSTATFIAKAARALELVRSELPSCCHHHPIPQGANDDL